MNVFSGHERDGVLDTGADILNRDIGVVISNDLVKSQSLIEQFKDALHGDACASDAGFAEMDLGVDDDSVDHVVTLP